MALGSLVLPSAPLPAARGFLTASPADVASTATATLPASGVNGANQSQHQKEHDHGHE